MENEEKALNVSLWRGCVPITFSLAMEDKAISSSFQKINLAHRSNVYANSKDDEDDE